MPLNALILVIMMTGIFVYYHHRLKKNSENPDNVESSVLGNGAIISLIQQFA